ncbi:Repeat domain-containing protein [Actinacidiphila alni]|uniref:Repeat domain-containing protein n=1 Tax=Actinacidiphila alni TaxID=380248 RepID=A0A1I2LEP6_9ACTN|nr:Repeat domain-containing protein [Actinacidiphila alni]
MHTPFHFSLRATVLTTAVALGTVAAGIIPAQAATGYDRCPQGAVCLFDQPGGQGAMTSFTSPQSALGAWDDKASSVYNRTGLPYLCMYSLADYQYLDAVQDVVANTSGTGNDRWELSAFTSKASTLDRNLSSLRWARTMRECQGGPEYLPWVAPYGVFKRPAQPFGDLNRDGREDLLLRTYSGKLWRLPGDGTGALEGSGWNSMSELTRHGDLNGDGTEDLLARDTSGRLWVYPGTGRGTFAARTSVGTGWNSMTAITASGDLDGDGKGDLLARDSTGKLWMYPGKGDGTFGARVLVGPGWNAMGAFAAPGDVTGDGHPDLLVTELATGKLWLYPGDGHGRLGTRTLAGTGGWKPFTTLLGIGDLTGDVLPDLVAATEPVTGAAGELRVYSAGTSEGVYDTGGHVSLSDGDALF